MQSSLPIPTLWPPDVKNWLIWKDPEAGKDWRWEEKGTKEDEMVGWHHWLNGKDSDAGRDWGQEEKGMTEDEMAGWRLWLDGRESEWTPVVGDGQVDLVWCDSWGCKESDTTEWLNWTELKCSKMKYPNIGKLGLSVLDHQLLEKKQAKKPTCC